MLFLLLVVLATFLASSFCHFSTSSENIFIFDDVNRVKFFHGENFVQKGFPWYPEVLLDTKHIEAMQSWGWNTIRLGVMLSTI